MEHEYQKLAYREEFYWWHIGRRRILYSILYRFLGHSKNLDILDVGCGSGGNARILGKFGHITGVDTEKEVLFLALEKGINSVIEGKAELLPFSSSKFGLVTIFDVLEHLPNDELAIREAHRILEFGGLLLITVPAFPILWSPHDVYLGHY